MKKLLLLACILFSGTVFSQTITNVPLNSEQEKQVKSINKKVQEQVEAIVENAQMTPEEKKSRVRALKTDRDAQLTQVLLAEQITTALSKDPIKWDNMMDKIDKIEKEKQKVQEKAIAEQQKAEAAKLKAEKNGKLAEVDKQMKDIENQKSQISSQINDLKKKQDGLNDQAKALKQKQKEIENQYK